MLFLCNVNLYLYLFGDLSIGSVLTTLFVQFSEAREKYAQ